MKVWIGVLLLALSANVFGEGRGVCNRRALPSSKSRKWSNHRLECTSNIQTYIRRPQSFDVKEWRKLDNLARGSGDVQYRNQMQALGWALPEIKWKGNIKYQTYEKWDWVERKYGKHPSCGYDVTVEKRRGSDGKIEEIEHKEMKSCYYEEDESESRFCSDESIGYDSEYVRPNRDTEWNPKVEGYYDVLPNKYDLLPGEIEAVNINNNAINGWTLSATSTNLHPQITVGDPWNEYKTEIYFDQGGNSSGACVYGGGGYHLKAKIYTLKRIQKRSPNAFRNPIDRFGREISPFTKGTIDSNGEKQKPAYVSLSDASAVLITAMSRQSREFSKDQKQVQQAELVNETDESVRKSEREQGFWKDTHVRIRLFRVKNWARDIQMIPHLYTTAAMATLDANSEYYDISFEDAFVAAGSYFAEFWKKFDVNFEPGAHYQFLVSMYQKGVPFYAQDCEDERFRKWWNCWPIKREDSWYSKELPLDFKMSEKAEDQRSGIQRLSEFQSKTMGEKISSIWQWITK